MEQSEIEKIHAEIARLRAETMKISAETSTPYKEVKWYEVILIVFATLALVAVVKLLAQHGII